MKKIRWTERQKNGDVLNGVEERNIQHPVIQKEGYLDWSFLEQKLPSKTFLQGKWKGRKGEDEDVTKYSVTKSKREYNGI